MTLFLPNGAPAVLTEWCNPFGFETGGATRYLGGEITPGAQVTQWNCKKPAIGRYRMTCEHGHQGQLMKLCADHARQFSVREMKFCPRCNIPPNDHRCDLTLTEIS